MTKTMKIILSVFFLLFAAGIIWLAVAARNAKNDADIITQTPKQETPAPAPQAETESTPEEAAAPTTTLTDDAKSTPAKKTAVRKSTAAPAQKSVYVYESYSEQASVGDAWAEAGVDANGNAYAEAYAY